MPACVKCGRPLIYARGLCQTHYAQARLKIGAGVTTWAKLEADGKCSPRSDRGVTERQTPAERLRAAVQQIADGVFPDPQAAAKALLADLDASVHGRT